MIISHFSAVNIGLLQHCSDVNSVMMDSYDISFSFRVLLLQ